MLSAPMEQCACDPVKSTKLHAKLAIARNLPSCVAGGRADFLAEGQYFNFGAAFEFEVRVF